MIVYDLQTFHINRPVPNCKSAHKLSRNSGKDNKDITSSQYQKRSANCIVSKGVNYTNEFSDHALSCEGEINRVNNENFE